MGELEGTTRNESKVKPHHIGKLGDFKCKFCQALLWKKEPKTLCCNSGQVPPINPSVIEDGDILQHYEEKNGKVPEVSITLKSAEGIQTREHKGVYHLPTSSSSVGAIVNLDTSNRHLQITIESPKPDTKYNTKIVTHENVFYDAFQYPLLIPNGNVGYSHSLKLTQKEGRKKRVYDRLTPASFYSSMYMEREGIFNYVTKCRRLFQQFVVDNYVKVESMRLAFIENNQSDIRKERSDILQRENGKDKGQRIIIPPTYVGGPRYMKQRQQDALAFVSNYGSPDFFMTFTMNPAWTELEESSTQTKSTSKNKGDRPDLVSRIFKMKIDSLIDDLTVRCVFGKVKAYLYSVEWQKRGLPHIHILLWMKNTVNAELVSNIISAEIPDKNKEPKLFEIVTKCLIHGPCKGFDESLVCCQTKSVQGKNCCGKGFPKPCRDNLLFGNNGYPLYRRRAIGEGGNSFEKKVKGNIVNVDNSWVVPYNPYLCLKYNAHINVECSNSIKAIAYVTRYVYMDCDRILYSKTKDDDEVINEVRNYQDARYVNASEAIWKIFKFPIHKSFPPVTTLDLHLEGENEIFFKNENAASLQRKTAKDTQLTAFFKLCKENEFAATLYYHEIPNHFIYDKANSKWLERKTRTAVLGRIRAVTNKTVELFYLRVIDTRQGAFILRRLQDSGRCHTRHIQGSSQSHEFAE
ncbi:uncharacterized protein LOC143020461 [Oratosquilla oratoria]|uniref:uncharacterized protein LOC143020461 n=1 Tax=Oratosquilla oratoria TaxID=337810 RepID=UPI003F771FD3